MMDYQKYNAPAVRFLRPNSIRSYTRAQINMFRTTDVKKCLGEIWSRIVDSHGKHKCCLLQGCEIRECVAMVVEAAIHCRSPNMPPIAILAAVLKASMDISMPFS